MLDELVLDRQAGLELELKAALHQRILQLVKRRGDSARDLVSFPCWTCRSRGRKPPRGLKGLRQKYSSAPSGLLLFSLSCPTACAVGCILAPLCG